MNGGDGERGERTTTTTYLLLLLQLSLFFMGEYTERGKTTDEKIKSNITQQTHTTTTTTTATITTTATTTKREK